MNDAVTPTLVLDLDGTLVDTAADLVATLNVILETEGLEPVAFPAAVAMVGNGSRAMLKAALVANGLNPEPDRLDNLTASFLDYYSDHLADMSRPYPGAVEALDRFTKAGWRLAVCTNKFEVAAKKLLSELGLAGYFSAVAGQDTFGVMKPDPRHLTETIRVAGGTPNRSVMVGDSGVDVATARGAHIPVVAVEFGYSNVPVTNLGADRIIGHFDKLFDAAAGLIKVQ